MELLLFRLLRHMVGIEIKANVLGEILGSNGLLRDVIRMTKATIVGRKTTEIMAFCSYSNSAI